MNIIKNTCYLIISTVVITAITFCIVSSDLQNSVSKATDNITEDIVAEEVTDIPIVEEQQSEDVEELEPEYEYYEESYYEPYTSCYENDFRSAGVVYGEDGTRYTWYSQNVLAGNGLIELNNNGRHVNEDGYVCDGEGYIAVASSDHEQGTIVETPFGTGKVYDSGCASGTIDVYTDF